jgi:hypothetical protein
VQMLSSFMERLCRLSTDSLLMTAGKEMNSLFCIGIHDLVSDSQGDARIETSSAATPRDDRRPYSEAF